MLSREEFFKHVGTSSAQELGLKTLCYATVQYIDNSGEERAFIQPVFSSNDDDKKDRCDILSDAKESLYQLYLRDKEMVDNLVTQEA